MYHQVDWFHLENYSSIFGRASSILHRLLENLNLYCVLIGLESFCIFPRPARNSNQQLQAILIVADIAMFPADCANLHILVEQQIAK